MYYLRTALPVVCCQVRGLQRWLPVFTAKTGYSCVNQYLKNTSSKTSRTSTGERNIDLNSMMQAHFSANCGDTSHLYVRCMGKLTAIPHYVDAAQWPCHEYECRHCDHRTALAGHCNPLPNPFGASVTAASASIHLAQKPAAAVPTMAPPTQPE